MIARHVPLLAGLATDLRRAEFDLTGNWTAVRDWFGRHADPEELRTELSHYLREVPAATSSEITSRSRETTTHFAWCLLDRPEDPFSFWLHEYKPQRDWRTGYADSVHNHRYHFCTTILHGWYRHERYDVVLGESDGLIASTTLRGSTTCRPGASGAMHADEFHRIPAAGDDTMTFLIKSRPVQNSSLSYDPGTGTAHRHVPVEQRLGELTRRI